MNAWYAALERPPLTPPAAVFGPVWTVLYVMIAIAIILFYRSGPQPRRQQTSILLAAHLAANAAWTSLFFGLQAPLAALVDILFLDASLLFLMARFWQANRLAALLLVPYLLWVLFATYLNGGFWILN